MNICTKEFNFKYNLDLTTGKEAEVLAAFVEII